MIDWQRRRHPEDVPTPVAVALSDFCRRARAPATAAVVREALALLEEADDFRVRELTDAEPPASPLGPFAVVDLVRGTPPELAAQRQQTGYYDMVRALAEERARSVPPPVTAPPPQRVVPFPAAEPKRASRDEEPGGKKRRSKGPTIAEKIAPRRRVAGEPRPTPAAPPTQVPASSFLPRRNLPAPRGRFIRVDPSRASFHALLRPEGAGVLAALVDQVPHRYALLRTLARSYLGRRGGELTLDDVEGLLDKHGLRERLEAKERDALRAARSAFSNPHSPLRRRPGVERAMPIYEYRCQKCGHQLEVMQKVSDPVPDPCPKCGAAQCLERLVSRTSFQLKGGGWYADLYSSTKKETKQDSSATSGETSSSSPSTSASSSTGSGTPAAGGGDSSSRSGGSGGSTSGGSTT
jgi:putative FmdB family regulatory protein